MTDTTSYSNDVEAVAGDLAVSSPHTPLPGIGEALEERSRETPRNQRRRGWQADKINTTRETQRAKRDNTLLELNKLVGSVSVEPVHHGALGSAGMNTGNAGQNNIHPLRKPTADIPKGRNYTQKRRDRPANRTPLHVLEHQYTRHTNQVRAIVSETISTLVNQGWGPPSHGSYRNTDSHRMMPGSMQQHGQLQLQSAWSAGNHQVLQHGVDPVFQHIARSQVDYGAYVVPALPCVYNTPIASYAPVPLPFSNTPNSFLHQHFAASVSHHYSKRVAPSHSSATHVEDSEQQSRDDQLVIVRTPSFANSKAAKSALRSERDHTVMYMGPSTSAMILVTDFDVENDFKPTNEPAQFDAAIPDPESSNCVPRLTVDGYDWDSVTKVPDDLAESRVLIEELMGSGEPSFPVVRSSTSPAACLAHVSLSSSSISNVFGANIK
jgi:hypothetical protein